MRLKGSNMAKFTLVCADARRIPHTGLKVTAYYKQQLDNPFEKPFKLIVYNKWPPVELEADVVEVPMGGIYEYPNGVRISTIIAFCPKTKDGTYWAGYSPQQIMRSRRDSLKCVKWGD